MLRIACFAVISLAAIFVSGLARAQPEPDTIRIATYNVSLYRERQGQLADELATGDCPQALHLATVIQSVRPDILLLNEIDYDPDNRVPKLLNDKYLSQSAVTLGGMNYPYLYTAPVNTGDPSPLDLNHNGKTGDPDDAYGFGRYPGQYGMAVLSRFPIMGAKARTFRRLKWSTMPNARRPVDPESGKSYYTDAEWQALRLSSKSHWDVPIDVPGLGRIHLLASHPTPPVFDGTEDRNGCRNHDEIRLWADYVAETPSAYLVDDVGQSGGIQPSESFVVIGDLNCDPVDGQSEPNGILQLLGHPRINAAEVPTSEGAIASAQAGQQLNSSHTGDPASDTANFSGDGVGNFRVDYVLPSRELTTVSSGVFWPVAGSPAAEDVTATDHRLTWI